MKIIALSSLEKVFHDEAPSAPEYKSFSMLKMSAARFKRLSAQRAAAR